MMNHLPRPTNANGDAVLRFWFEESKPYQWFRRDDAFDAAIKLRFGALHRAASEGRLEVWRAHPVHSLSLIILLDQFSRNLYRDTPRAFAQDEPQPLPLAWLRPLALDAELRLSRLRLAGLDATDVTLALAGSDGRHRLETLEAAFYEGTRRLGAGDVAGARELFQSVLESGMVSFYEYAMAQELLVALPSAEGTVAEQ